MKDYVKHKTDGHLTAVVVQPKEGGGIKQLHLEEKIYDRTTGKKVDVNKTDYNDDRLAQMETALTNQLADDQSQLDGVQAMRADLAAVAEIPFVEP